jgi:uncharacterized protein (TIGR00255 family)
MTGFAVREGTAPGLAWRWEARSVNARGLDLKLRLPEGWEALEVEARRRVQARLRRGAVAVQLKLDDTAAAGATRLDRAALAAALDAAVEAGRLAAERGLAVAPPTLDGLLRLPGVLDRRAATPDPDARAAAEAAVLRDLDRVLDDLDRVRASEGAALAASLGAAIDGIARHAAEAETAHREQAPLVALRLRDRLATLLGAGAAADPDRLAQELALLAVKLDVREELDRLAAHLAAARALIDGDGPAGRQLDFLAQEFNREVNTLCSKADSVSLTACGLAMKVLVDQLREQAQNVE